MRRSSKDPLNLGNVKMHARFEALDVVGFVAGVRYALSQIESGKSAVTIKLALCKKCKCEFGVNVLDKGVCEFCRGQAEIASDPKPKKRGSK